MFDFLINLLSRHGKRRVPSILCQKNPHRFLVIDMNISQCHLKSGKCFGLAENRFDVTLFAMYSVYIKGNYER